MSTLRPAPPLRVVLTGSAAPFAAALADRLRERGHVVEVVDSTDTWDLPTLHAALVAAPPDTGLRDAVAGADVTVLLTGLGPLTSVVDDATALDVVLTAARPDSGLVQLSTLAVFGDLGGATVDESAEPDAPSGLEAVRAAELRARAADDRLRTLVMRTGLVYGAGGGPLLQAAVDHARARGVSRYFGAPDSTYPLAHTDDLLDALTHAVEDRSVRGVQHVVSDHVTARGLADVVARAAGVDRVEPWDAETLEREVPGASMPPAVDVRVGHASAQEGSGTAPRLVQELLGAPDR